jgi:hypothetical protein
LNRPPHVALLSPANNSFLTNGSVRLQWKGTDPDGDPLRYAVRWSDRPLSTGSNATDVAGEERLDLTGMMDNETYYWTVDASDGKNDGTDVPTEIWRFTVRLPPANIPVRITSTPPLVAWVGKEYFYNMTSVDEDGDIPVYSIASGPPAMTVDPSTGKSRWMPVAGDAGNRSVTVQVSDGQGSTDQQTFIVTVLEPPVPPIVAPRCAIDHPANGSRVSGAIQARGTATSGSAPLSRVLVRMDSGDWKQADGLDNWTLAVDTSGLGNGRHRIEARALGGDIYSETASVEFLVKNPVPSVSSLWDPWCFVTVMVGAFMAMAVVMLARSARKT